MALFLIGQYIRYRQRFLTTSLFVALFLTSLFMRFYQLPDLFYFTHDEETMVFRMLKMLKYGEPFLIGGVTPLHVHTTPYHYYISAMVLAFGHLDPLVWGYFSGLIGLLTTILIWAMANKLVSKWTAIMAAFFYASSYLIAIFDRHYWPLTLDPLLGLVVFISLYRIIKKDFSAVYTLVMALIMGFSSDWSNLLLFAVTVVVWFVYRLPVRKKEVARAAVIFFISFIPLIFFDLRHGFTNISQVNQFFFERKETIGWSWNRFRETLLFIPRVASRLVYVFGDQEVAKQYSYCTEHSVSRLQAVPWWMVATFFIGVVYAVYRFKTRESSSERLFLHLILIFFGVAFLGINVYGNFFSSTLHDHYLATLFAVIALFYGYLIVKFVEIFSYGKRIAIVIFLTFLITNGWSMVHARNTIGYMKKMAAVKYAVHEIGPNEFSLDSLGSCYKYGGWRYLFTLAGHEPVKSYVDKNYFWLYEKPPARNHPEWLIVMVTPETKESEDFYDAYNYYLKGTVKRATFGTIEVLVVDNKKHQYDGKY